MRILIFILALLAASPALAQTAPADNPGMDQRPKHLIVVTRAGPNFDRLAEMRAQVQAHRDIYLKLTAQGAIVASGPFEGKPVLGITVFRQGVDEAAIRKLLADDAIIKAGVLELEFRYWSIQMGALTPPAPTTK